MGATPNAAVCTARVVKFSKAGKFLKTWGKTGSQPGEFLTPHCLTLDSRERVVVCDRFNGRLQVFDPDGKLLEQWRGYGKPTGIFLAKDDTLYVSDSLASWAARLRPDPKFPNLRAGWYVGSAKDGMVKWFVPDEFGGPEDITADARGDVYTAEWGPQTIRKFILDPARVVLMDKEPRQKSLGRE